jgi:hypothetical protein
VAFHQNVSSSVVSQWSSKILEMQEDGTLPDLKAKWIFNPTDGCGVNSQASCRRPSSQAATIGNNSWLAAACHSGAAMAALHRTVHLMGGSRAA